MLVFIILKTVKSVNGLLFRAPYRKIVFMRLREKWALIGVSIVVLFLGATTPVFAQSASTNYKVEESFFGTGGELDASSPNYRAKQSAGETTVGNASSANYQFNAGFNTTDQPLLEFAVDGGTYDLGILDPTITGSAVAHFTVRNYLSSGYLVRVTGAAPSSVGGNIHTLSALSSPTNSTPATEQFGINLATNTNPNIGTSPSQSPDSSFGFGTAAAGYDTSNLFKFLNGDTVAFSSKSSGQTNYALSIIANVSRDTPSGQYGGTLNLEVIPTF